MPNDFFQLLSENRLQSSLLMGFVDVCLRKEECHENDQTSGQKLERSANQTSQTCQLLSLYAQFLLSFMSLLCAREYGYCQSSSVKRPFYHLEFCFVFDFITRMSKFVLLTERIREGKDERQQKMVILSMVKHCAIPKLPSPDTTASSDVLLQGQAALHV